MPVMWIYVNDPFIMTKIKLNKGGKTVDFVSSPYNKLMVKRVVTISETFHKTTRNSKLLQDLL